MVLEKDEINCRCTDRNKRSGQQQNIFSFVLRSGDLICKDSNIHTGRHAKKTFMSAYLQDIQGDNEPFMFFFDQKISLNDRTDKKKGIGLAEIGK